MPIYMTQFAYTAEAWAALCKNPEDRSVPVRALAEKLGGQLFALYYSFGEYDGIIIYEVPDETAAAALVLAATSPGHLKSVKTVPLLSVEQAMEAMRTAGGLTYRGPRG